MKQKVNVTLKGGKKKQVGVLNKKKTKVTVATGNGLKDVDVKDVTINT